MTDRHRSPPLARSIDVRISVVIPTYQRREQVVACVRSLDRQRFDRNFEVLVVVDGSTDGSADVLRALATRFPLRVLEQPNQGVAAARTAGGGVARGEILLFLDDDMEADSHLLAEHERSHCEGAAVVVGHMPLHPESPRNLLSTLVHRWVEKRCRRLSVRDAELRASHLVGGQISVAKEAFQAVGGFDASLARGQDMEFGYRLLRQGYRAVFNPNAISWQRYTVSPRQFLSQCRQGGRSDVAVARKHPEMAAALLKRPENRLLFRLLARFGPLVTPVRWLAVPLVGRGYRNPFTKRLFSLAKGLEYCRGLHEAGGLSRRQSLRVLAYHAVDDAAASGRFARYVVTPEAFREQMATLRTARYEFVSTDEVVHFVCGSGFLPRRPVLVTFDDCFASIIEHALPVLEADGMKGAAFAVTGRVGGTSDWSRSLGAPQVPLADREGLHRLARAGIEIGSHSRSHKALPDVSPLELTQEVSGSSEDLQTLGLGRARVFAYPYGESNERVRLAVKRAGCRLAFTTEPGVVRPGSDPYQLPRVEILRSDRGWKFRLKVALAGSPPYVQADRLHEVRRRWRRRRRARVSASRPSLSRPS